MRFNNTATPFAGSPLGTVRRSGGTMTGSLMGIDFTHLFTPTFLVEAAQPDSAALNERRRTASGAGIDVA